MIRLHIAWANALYRWRLFGHWLYEATHEKADDGWADELHRMNQDESWAGLRFRAGQLRDARGRFVNPDKEIRA